MSLDVETFRTLHLQLLIAQGVQGSQIQQVSHVPASYASVARPPGLAMTVTDADRIVMCGGVIPTSQHHGVLWAVLARDAGRHMLWLHRATRRFLGMDRRRRIEATVQDGFPAGCRWLEMLGFKWEGQMPGYGDNGETHIRYGRVL